MGTSRASTPAGKRRAATKARTRSGAAHPPRKPAAKKPVAKKPVAKKPVAKKPAPKKAVANKPSPPKRKPPAKTPVATGVPRAKLAALTFGRVAFISALIAIVLAATYMLWFRDSKFVAVEDVTVTGINGPEKEAVTAALTKSAGSMTTLNLDSEELAASVTGFGTVAAITPETDFPHGLVVKVTERPPVLLARQGDDEVAVTGEGLTLPGLDVSALNLPTLEVDAIPAKGKLTGEPLEIASVTGAAPGPLLPMIDGFKVEEGSITIELRGGIPVLFGEPTRPDEKWAAVAAVLSNPKVDTMTQLDVRVPERPSIGGAAPPVEETAAEEPEVAPTLEP